jgi:putative peptide zinc metalloprotease protein
VEKTWLVLYGVLSSIYRVFITVAIALFIASEFFVIGVVLALWAVAVMGVLPVVKGVQYLIGSARLRQHRRRVLAVSAAIFAALVTLFFLVPAPFHTVVEGVAWLPPSALVRAGNEGFVERLVATPGRRVETGDLLIQVRDPALESKLRVSEGKVAELEAVYSAQLVADRGQAAIARDQLDAERTALASVRERVDTLSVRAQSAGMFMVPKPQDMPGRYYRQGELLGYVVDKPQLIARVVVAQQAVDAVRASTTRVLVRLAHQPDVILQGRLVREVPAGDEYLPSRVLATEGGGQLSTDPRDAKGARTMERTFQFDVAVQAPSPEVDPNFFGERVHARFEHPSEPLAYQWYRSVRRLFLSHFHV